MPLRHICMFMLVCDRAIMAFVSVHKRTIQVSTGPGRNRAWDLMGFGWALCDIWPAERLSIWLEDQLDDSVDGQVHFTTPVGNSSLSSLHKRGGCLWVFFLLFSALSVTGALVMAHVSCRKSALLSGQMCLRVPTGQRPVVHGKVCSTAGCRVPLFCSCSLPCTPKHKVH